MEVFMEIVLGLIFVVIIAGIIVAKRKKVAGPKEIVRPESMGNFGYVPPMPDDEITDALAAASLAAKNKE
jgi:hypothetical protein